MVRPCAAGTAGAQELQDLELELEPAGCVGWAVCSISPCFKIWLRHLVRTT